MCKRGESLGIIYFSFPSLLGKLLQLGQMWSGQSMNAGVQFPLQPILWQRIQWIGICYTVSSAYTIRGNTKLPFRSCKLSSITKLFERFIHASNEFIFHTPLPLLLPLPLPLGSSFSTSPPPTSMASFCVLTPWFSMATYQCYTSNKGLITHTFLGSGGVSWAPPPPTMACPALTDLEQTTTTVSS